MFLTNKYSNTYYSIINAARARDSVACYTELHHIIPKSIGGNNSKDNLVLLTGREHFVCHMLLIRMTTGIEKCRMIFAARMMLSSGKNQIGRYTPSSHTYQHLKEMAAKARSIIQTGTKQSPESNEKRRAALIGKKRGPVSPETVTRMSLAKKGKPSGKKGKPSGTKGKTYEEIYGLESAASIKQKRSIAWSNRKVLESTRNIQSMNRKGKGLGGDNTNAKPITVNGIQYETTNAAFNSLNISRYKFKKLYPGIL